MAYKRCSIGVLNAIIAFFGLVLYARALTVNLDEEWKHFKNTYKKKYNTKEEEAKRRQIFEDNAKFIAMHNIQENMGMHSFKLGVNDKTDMSDEEFQVWSSCYKDNRTLEKRADEILEKKLCEDEYKNKADEDKSKHKPLKDKLKCKPSEDKSKHKPPKDKSEDKPPEDKLKCEPLEDKSKCEPCGRKSKCEPCEDKSEQKHPENKSEDHPPEDKLKCKHPEDKPKCKHPEDKHLSAKVTSASLDYGEDKSTNKTDKDGPKPKTDKKLNANNETAGDQLDYREKGMVSPVTDQGMCNACYAFAALGALEAQMMKKTGKLVPLSGQNIIDCSADQGNRGCYTGHIFGTYLYVFDNNGVNSLAQYPSTQKKGTCNFQKDDIAGTISSIQSLSKGEGSILTALKTVGPVSAAMVGNTKLFQNYKSGIFEDPNCKGDFTLSVLIVGYGTDAGKKYWLVKNGRGTAWGEKGYFRIARGKNMCRIGERGSYPKI